MKKLSVNPWGLDYWNSEDWQKVQRRLDEMERRHERVNPRRDLLTACLHNCSLSDTRVAILGQDPYPDGRFATGEAFSIPVGIAKQDFPATLRSIFGELSRDMHIPIPSHGNLSRWTSQGVLLLNAIPSTREGESLAHVGWEYHDLTREIVTRLQSEGGIVFAFLGGYARNFAGYVKDDANNKVIITSHPSPRGSLNSKVPFVGSRLFSTINEKLVSLGRTPIDWRVTDDLSEPVSSPSVQRSGVVWESGRTFLPPRREANRYIPLA